MQLDAVFSSCGRYRHQLTRRWGPGALLPFVMLNPSTADAATNDPTARKGIGFAQRLGFDGIAFANLSDYCATYPRDLRAAGYPISTDADASILIAAGLGDGRVICGWGANARGHWGAARSAHVLAMLRECGFVPCALRLLSDGVPEHPLMLPYSCAPIAL